MLTMLLTGASGQLGAGMVEAADTAESWQAMALLRRRGSRSVDSRAQGIFSPRPEALAGSVCGDITKPGWGLSDDEIERLSNRVDVVVNLAGDTGWVAPERDLAAANVAGALHGYALADRLQRLSQRPIPFVYVSTIFVAPVDEARVSEVASPSHGGRTPYEHSKWMGERALVAKASRRSGPPLMIARIAALVGNSRTGATVRRNSLYLLADHCSATTRLMIPLARGARVDALPRDVAGGLLVDAVERFVANPSSEPTIIHVAAGDAAPSTHALLDTARAASSYRRKHVPRHCPLPSGLIVWGCDTARRNVALSGVDRSALIGLRYVALDRVFETDRLAGLLGRHPAIPGVETLARLLFGSDLLPEPATLGPSYGPLARFAS
jgi:thioester reductase-like protein